MVKATMFGINPPILDSISKSEDDRIEIENVHYDFPILLKLIAFRMGRTSLGLELDDSTRVYRYYKDRG
jgi:hypothetical protein